MTIIPPGVIAAGKSSPAPYHASAVHFGGAANLHTASLTATGDSTGFCSGSFWFKATIANFASAMIWVVDPLGSYTSNFQLAASGPNGQLEPTYANATNSLSVFINAGTMAIAPSVWHNIMFSVQTNLGAGSKILQLYADDAVVTGGTVGDFGAAFLMTFNGKSFYIGQDTFGVNFTGDMADFWMAPGVFTDWSVTANRRKFISAAGKPVDPSGFPASALLFSGDATTFGTNQGTGGAFTATGSLTNASTSPSD